MSICLQLWDEFMKEVRLHPKAEYRVWFGVVFLNYIVSLVNCELLLSSERAWEMVRTVSRGTRNSAVTWQLSVHNPEGVLIPLGTELRDNTGQANSQPRCPLAETMLHRNQPSSSLPSSHPQLPISVQLHCSQKH